MKNINWNELTPACYAIANANDVDLGVGGSMVQNNIRHSKAVDIGAENLPVAFRPDWDALGADAGRGAVHGAGQGRLRVPVHHQFLVL